MNWGKTSGRGSTVQSSGVQGSGLDFSCELSLGGGVGFRLQGSVGQRDARPETLSTN